MLINWFTVFAQIINFLILIFLLKRFLYGPIMRAMEAREKKIAEAFERAKKSEEEAKRKALELSKEKKELLDAKESFLSQAKAEVREWREKTLAQARQEIDTLRQAWLDRLSHEKEAFLYRLKEQTVNQIMRIGRKVMGELANEELEHQIMAVFLKKIEEQTQPEFESFTGTVIVRSGIPLDEDIRKTALQILTPRFPDAESLIFQETENLGLGIILHAGDIKVEWNLSNYLQELEKEILADLSGSYRHVA